MIQHGTKILEVYQEKASVICDPEHNVKDSFLSIVKLEKSGEKLRPERPPFMSAMKQGTPAWLNVSVITCRVTVLPVPVAPAINPWRFAIFPQIEMGPAGPWAT